MKFDENSLEDLLRAAGRRAGPTPPPRDDLAHRVRSLLARRRRKRRLAAGVAATVLLAAAVLVPLLPATGPPATRGPAVAGHKDQGQTTRALSYQEIERLRAEIARLDAEADRRQRAVEEMIRAERLQERIAKLQQQPEEANPLELARVEIEKTAFLLVDYADWRATSSPGAFPVDEYRRVLAHFPETAAADTAKQRIQNPKLEKGEL